MNRKTYPHPATIRQAAQIALDGYDYTSAVKELIDHVIREVKKAGGYQGAVIPIPKTVFSEEPPHIENDVQRVYLAGLAEYMAHVSASPSPEWADAEKYALKGAFFFGGEHSREILLRETPAAFRNRLLFSGRSLIKLFSMLNSEKSRRSKTE